MNYAVHGLAKRDADAFIVGPELIAPRAYQQQQVGGTVVCAAGRGMIYFRESIVFDTDHRMARMEGTIQNLLFTFGNAGRYEYGSCGCFLQTAGFLLGK